MKCKICNQDNQQVEYVLKKSNVFKCSNCGFHYSDYLDREISEENSSSLGLTDELRNYLRFQLQSNDERFENHVKISLKQLGEVNRPKILDVGCGGGLYLSKMKRTRDVDCYGIELDTNRLQFTKEEHGLNNIYALPIQSDFWIDEHEGSFDLITFWDVIEHVNYPRIVFDAASRLLKEDGLLIMDTPCRDTFYHKFGEFSYRLTNGAAPTFLNIMYSNHPYGHKQIFSKKDLLKLYEDYSFGVLDTSVFHELSFPTRYYLEKMFKSESLVNLINPVVTTALNVFRIRNKMVFVGKKKTASVEKKINENNKLTRKQKVKQF